jgi:hypothetical protein
MAEDPKPVEGAATTDATATVHPGMSEQEIRDAGLAVDVPYESGSPEPERLRYADLGMTWTPPEGWPPEDPAAAQPPVADGGVTPAG